MADIRKLSKDEKRAWVREAREFDRELEPLGVDELKARFEEMICRMERQELSILILERQLNRKGCPVILLGGPPLRKSAEAMELAFGRRKS